MKVVAIGQNNITYYQSIRELPIGLYSEFQKYVMQEGGLGSDLGSVHHHYEKLLTFYRQRNDEAFTQEYTNLQYNLIHILEKITVSHYAFGCLLYAINGERITDYTEAGLKHVLEKLTTLEVSHQQVETILEEVKKNWIPN